MLDIALRVFHSSYAELLVENQRKDPRLGRLLGHAGTNQSAYLHLQRRVSDGFFNLPGLENPETDESDEEDAGGDEYDDEYDDDEYDDDEGQDAGERLVDIGESRRSQSFRSPSATAGDCAPSFSKFLGTVPSKGMNQPWCNITVTGVTQIDSPRSDDDSEENETTTNQSRDEKFKEKKDYGINSRFGRNVAATTKNVGALNPALPIQPRGRLAPKPYQLPTARGKQIDDEEIWNEQSHVYSQFEAEGALYHVWHKETLVMQVCEESWIRRTRRLLLGRQDK